MNEGLKKTISEVRDRLERYRNIYENNEQAVREQIVLPLLESLGWDTKNPDEITPNERIEQGVPDYTLKLDGKRILFIEVKSLRDRLDDGSIRQLARYCTDNGVPFGILTNGKDWILMEAFREGKSYRERSVWKLDMKSEDISMLTEKLMDIAKSEVELLTYSVRWQSFICGDMENVLMEGFRKYLGVRRMDKNLIRFMQRKIRKIAEILKPSEVSMQAEHEAGTGLVSKPGHKRQKTFPKVRKLYIGEEVFPINHSYEVLINTAEWLISKGKLNREDCPIDLGFRFRYLINTKPEHSSGEKFRAPKKLSSGLWIDTHYSTEQAIRLSQRLLNHFGYKDIRFRVE